MKTFLALIIAFGALVSVSVSTSCGIDTCADDEYCNGNLTACQCNSTASYNYIGSNLAPTITCSDGTLNIFVSKCWLEENGFNTSSVRLKSPDCLATKEITNNTAQMSFHTPLIINYCNTTAEVTGTQVTYTNALYAFSVESVYQMQRVFVMNVSCTVPLSVSAQLLITLKPALRIISVNIPGANISVVRLWIYKDESFTSPLSDNDTLYMGDTVYISVITNLSNLKVERMYVSAGESENPQYDLLLNGCPAGGLLANLITVISNGADAESRFAMKVFQISGFDSFRLSADVLFCEDHCVPNCTEGNLPIVSTNTTSVICTNGTCAGDEYCDSSGTACQCNSTIYHYTENPAPTVDCNGGKLHVFISKCLLERNGYTTSSISLQSSSCLADREIVNGTAQMTFHRPLMNNDCGDIVELNTTHVTYRNTLNIFAVTTPLQTREDFAVNISCTYPLRLNVPPNATLNPILGTTLMSLPGTNTDYTVIMAAYGDNSFSTLLPATDPIYPDGAVYISVGIPDLDFNIFKTKVLRIFVSSEESNTPQDLLLDGCPTINQTTDIVTVISNGIGNESRFIIKNLQFPNLVGFRLSADVILCTDNCTSGCSSQTQSTDPQGNISTVSIFLRTSKIFFYYHFFNSIKSIYENVVPMYVFSLAGVLY
ncbi:uncharacterized protein LOC143934576 [Lithobates pipiens]